MRDDRSNIETCFKETSQPVPCAEQAPAGDPIDTDTLKNNFVRQIKAHGAGWNAEQGHSSAVFHRAKDLAHGRGVSRHLQCRIDSFTGGHLKNGLCHVLQ